MPKNPEMDLNEKAEPNEGEGNKTAAREYNRNATEHAKSGHVSDEGKAAREAVEHQGEDLKRAEDVGKSKIAEEDPEVRGK